ncbi:hypothetical protein [Sporosarcina sp. SAFN-010]|uniref:hypothetical protein n=1 Tax=Sporosarcina sp. SAFN-010 TaxID=3387273 RepID=UPI003F8219B5
MDKELINTLKYVLDDALQPIHHRLDRMDQRFDGLDQRLDGMDHRLDGMDNKFDGMNKKFDGMDNKFDGMDQRIGSLEVELKEFPSETKTSLQLIQNGQRSTREEMTQRFNETREGFQRIEADFKFVNHKTADHELKFNRLENESKENRQ